MQANGRCTHISRYELCSLLKTLLWLWNVKQQWKRVPLFYFCICVKLVDLLFSFSSVFFLTNSYWKQHFSYGNCQILRAYSNSRSLCTLTSKWLHDDNWYILPRSMATGDMDKDGFEDFVVGAPGYNVKGSPQEGRVYIIYGNGNYCLCIHKTKLKKNLVYVIYHGCVFLTIYL